MTGYIKLHRQIWDCPLWEEEHFSKGQAWVDLLLLANHKDHKTLFRGEMVIRKRGEVNRSISFLAKRWKWTRKTVKRFLTILERENMVKMSISKRDTIIQITNYEKFQNDPTKEPVNSNTYNPLLDSEGTSKDTSKGTSEGTSEDSMNNNEKECIRNINNNINNTISPKMGKKRSIDTQNAKDLFERLWSMFPNKKGKAKVSDKTKLKLLEIGEEEMLRAIERYKIELDKDDWRKLQYGSTFFNSGYVDYLDENYEPSKQKTGNPFLDMAMGGMT